MIQIYNSELVRQVVVANEQVMSVIEQLVALNEQIQSLSSELQTLREALEAKRNMIPRCREEAIIDYNTFIGFRKGLERLGVASYQYGCYVALLRFKVRYPGWRSRKIHSSSTPKTKMF